MNVSIGIAKLMTMLIVWFFLTSSLLCCFAVDYSMVVSLVDDSVSTSNDKLKCVLFGGDASKLPSARPGNIIRFHRLKVG